MLAAFLPALALDSNLLPDGSLSYSIISILHPRPARSPWHAPCVSAERYDTPWDVRRQRRIHCLRARDFFFFFFQAQAKMWPQKSLDSQGGFTAPVRNHWQTSLINFTSELKDWELTFCQNAILNLKILSQQTHLNTPFWPVFFSLCIKMRHQMEHFLKIHEIYFTCPSGKSPNKWLQSCGPWRWMDEHSVCLIQSWPIGFLHCQAEPARGFLLV